MTSGLVLHGPRHQKAVLGALMIASATLILVSMTHLAQRNQTRTQRRGDKVEQRWTSADNMSEITRRQLERHNLLVSACSQIPEDKKSRTAAWSEFFVDDRRQYIYCQVEQVACTSWKRTLIDLSGDVTDAGKSNFSKTHGNFTSPFLRQLSSYSPHEIDHRLKTYYKFMFARHPFERLVSAYCSEVSRQMGCQSLRQEGSRRPSEVRSKFADFVRFVLGEATEGKQIDIRWRPQHAICRPCHVNYDFVGHYETLFEDADCVLNRIGRATSKPDAETDDKTESSSGRSDDVADLGKLRFSRSDPDSILKDSADLVDSMMATLTPADVDGLYTLYELDFRLFGYRRMS